MFVDRIGERAELEKILNSKSFEFAIIYGRRRIGKTRLILEMLKNRNHIYYLAVEKNNLRYFIDSVSKKFPDVLKLKEDWEILLEFLKDKLDAIVIDEFQNLVAEDHAVLSNFQRIIDNDLKNTRLKLIISGSSVSLMTSEVLNYKSPLYGRKTFSKKLQAMDFFDIADFFPDAKIIELAEIYGFADGIPFYLEKIKHPFWNWLDQELAEPTFLKDELNFILKYEFTDLGTYKTILEAIANGKTTVGEIKDYAKLQRTDISAYLIKLTNTEFIYRSVPITERVISKKGRYYIQDQFVAFWFRFVQPNLSGLEEGVCRAKDIKSNYPQYMGFVFEKICKQFLARQIKQGKFNFNKTGKWWDKDREIDIVAINDAEASILFAECKWQEDVSAIGVLNELKEKVPFVDWRNKNRKERYAIFAKSFKSKKSLGDDVVLFDLKDLEEQIKKVEITR